MFTHLLVPLDGSRLAEAALPAAASLAAALEARVTLFHVIERAPPREVHGERHLAEPAEAQAYLDAVAARALPGAAVACHVHEGVPNDVVESLVAHAAELAPDLVVMCAHGRGGLGRLLFGTIAQQVIARGRTPVLVVRPGAGGGAPPFACRRLLVPLDGSAPHEVGLPVGVALARALGAEVLLTAVVPTRATLGGAQAAVGQLLPRTAAALLDLERDELAGYLDHQVGRLAGAGVEVSAELCRGDPATAIRDCAARRAVDLVVLASHGRVGVEAFLAGSVATTVARQAAVPLLVVPIAG